MSLHFILGGSGTGKSTLLLQRLIRSAMDHPAKRHIMLVPEQYTMQTQRNVVRMHPNHAVMNIDILSFERLAYRVMAELGQEDIHILTAMGKNMMLRQICTEHEKELSIFRRSLRKPGFISRLMTILSEFYQYGITEEQLKDLGDGLTGHPLLAGKLKDLNIFYEAMNRAKDDHTITAEELLPVLLRLLPRAEFLKDTVIAMDCFTGFTPVQYRLIRQILQQAEQVEMAFLLPEEEWREESREEDLFHMSQSVVYLCSGMAKELGLEVTKEFCHGDRRHTGSPELAFMAEHFLRKRGSGYEGVPAAVTAFSCRNPREEAEAAASAIRRLVMETGCRYRDIAVAAGDPEEYRPFLENAFRRYHIPCFLDRKKGILGNPLVEFLQSAMEVIRTDFSEEAVFRFLKCGIPVMEAEDVDLLENYCLANRIEGRRRWEEEWLSQGAVDAALTERLNELRCQLLHVLAPVIESRNLFLHDGDQKIRILVSERTQVLRRLMDDNHTAEHMTALAEELRSDGRGDRAEEMERTEEYLRDLLDQMDDLLGELGLSMAEFDDLMTAGLSEARLGMIPTSLDQVSVGDVMRTRLGEIRHLIILGFNEGVIPGAPAGGGILSENERSLLESKNLILAPSAEHMTNQERFYLYRLMTAPSESIRILSSRMSADGSVRRESHLWAKLMQVFPELVMAEYRGQSSAQICDSDEAWRVFAAGMHELHEAGDHRELMELGEYLRREDPAIMEKIVDAAFEPERMDSIGRAAARALYGDTILGSITRLEKYAGCAYAHFLNYGLRLAVRNEGEFRHTDRGNFFHATLEHFFRTCVENGLDPGTMEDTVRTQMVKDALKAAAAQVRVSPMEQYGSGQYQYHRWEQLADRTVEVICRMLAREGFVPGEFELEFDGRTNASMNLELGSGRRMILRGKVDRVDTMNGQEGHYVRIVDYKTGKASVDLNAVYQGLQLQLPLYLGAVLEREENRLPESDVIPGGICYYHLEDPWVEVSADAGEDEVEEERLKKLKMGGWILDEKEALDSMAFPSGEKLDREQFGWLCSHVKKKAARFGSEILDGRILAAPYEYKERKGCTYCEYSAVCGFNPRRAGSSYRRIPEQKKEDIWKQLKEENDGYAVD